MLNKILKITAAAAFMVALAINIDMTLNTPFTGMSTEAIATNGAGACCQNGYKTWHATSNNPLQRKQYFKDCWCNSKSGYDPVECECSTTSTS